MANRLFTLGKILTMRIFSAKGGGRLVGGLRVAGPLLILSAIGVTHYTPPRDPPPRKPPTSMTAPPTDIFQEGTGVLSTDLI